MITIQPQLKPFDDIIRDVLKSIPPDSSPVFSLLPEIWAAPQVLAPEKRDLLVPYLRQIKLRCNTAEFVFSTSGQHITISDGALNLLWCASYASWFIYQAYVDAQKNALSTMPWAKDKKPPTPLASMSGPFDASEPSNPSLGPVARRGQFGHQISRVQSMSPTKCF